MKTIHTLGALLLGVPVFAQITVGPADFASAGDTLRRATGVVSGFDGADTGPAHVWDFGTLAPLAETADTLVTVASTPLLYQFFFNNPFDPDHQANYAMKGTDFGFGALTVTDLYDYYKKNGDGLRNVGFGANINGLPASIQREPVDWIHHFPMDYADEDSSQSYFELDVPGVIFFAQDQMRHNYVDGWGTLYLPTDTFEVLRVRSVLTRVDTIHVTTPFPFGFTLPEPETVEYKWIAAGQGGPVLQINTTGGIAAQAEFLYAPDSISTGTTDPIAVNAQGTAVAFPNPADDVVFVRLPERSQGTLVLLDAAGRAALAARVDSGSSMARLNTAGLAEGTYTLRLLGSGTDWSGKLAIERR